MTAGTTALIFASQNGDIAVVQALIAADWSTEHLRMTSNAGFTALAYATDLGHDDIAALPFARVQCPGYQKADTNSIHCRGAKKLHGNNVNTGTQMQLMQCRPWDAVSGERWGSDHGYRVPAGRRAGHDDPDPGAGSTLGLRPGEHVIKDIALK